MCSCRPHSEGPTVSARATVITRRPRARAALRAAGCEGLILDNAIRNACGALSFKRVLRASEGPTL